jgi:hypothetical protein
VSQRRWDVSDAKSIAYCLHAEREAVGFRGVFPASPSSATTVPCEKTHSDTERNASKPTKQASEVMSESI